MSLKSLGACNVARSASAKRGFLALTRLWRRTTSSRAPASEPSPRNSGCLSTGWFELGRLPYSWWPQYFLKKFGGYPHWQIGQTLLLSHPGCLLSYHRTFSQPFRASSTVWSETK